MTTALDKVLAMAGQSLGQPAQEHEDADPGRLLVVAAAAGLEEACLLLSGAELSSCPPEVLQAAALVYASAGSLEGLGLSLDESWVEATALDTTALALAGDSAKPYGDVPYADPGYQKDGKKRYPLDKDHIRAALAYFSKPSNREPYSSDQVKAIWGRIKSAASKAGISVSDSTGKVAATAALLELAAGPVAVEVTALQHKPFHGLHSHPHVHLNDNRHGPRHVQMAAGRAGKQMAESSAYVHKPFFGAHSHSHVHAGEANHGPVSGEPQHEDSGW
jgi:hypothetical protein